MHAFYFVNLFLTWICIWPISATSITKYLTPPVTWLYSSGFPGYGYFQTTTPAAPTVPVPTTQTNGVHSILQQPGTERQVNGSASYYEYSSHAQVQPTSRTDTTNLFTNIRDSSGYARNGTEVQLTGPMTSQITPATNTTPALVAQALSGM